MIDFLLGNLPTILGLIAAAVAAIFGHGYVQRRKGRKEGKKDAYEEFREADQAEADAIRRRAADARDDHRVRGDSGRGFRD